MTKVFSDRRLFLKCEGNSYKLLSFTQRNDGSIYIGFPNFRNIQWIGIELGKKEATLALIDSTEDEGKLSFHASGVVGFRSHDEPGDHQLRIKGNYLYDRHNSKAGIRHLASIYMEKPEELPAEFPQRISDFWIQNTSSLRPFVLVLFAVPRVSNIQNVGIQAGFHMDDLESSPPESGGGLIDLKYHWIFWHTYRTKFMNDWPNKTFVCYHDGFTVPMYLGRHQDESSGDLRFEVHFPKYEVDGSEVTIILDTSLRE